LSTKKIRFKIRNRGATIVENFSRTRPPVQGLRRRGRGHRAPAATQRGRGPAADGPAARQPAAVRGHRQRGRVHPGRHVGLPRDDRPFGGRVRPQTDPGQRRRGVPAVLERHDRPVQRGVPVAREPAGQPRAVGTPGHRSRDRAGRSVYRTIIVLFVILQRVRIDTRVNSLELICSCGGKTMRKSFFNNHIGQSIG